jgi:hypothetical protein
MNVSGIGNCQAFANFDGGRFARAIGTEETEALTASHFEVEAFHGHHIRKDLAQPAQQKCGTAVAKRSSLRLSQSIGLMKGLLPRL